MYFVSDVMLDRRAGARFGKYPAYVMSTITSDTRIVRDQNTLKFHVRKTEFVYLARDWMLQGHEATYGDHALIPPDGSDRSIPLDSLHSLKIHNPLLFSQSDQI